MKVSAGKYNNQESNNHRVVSYKLDMLIYPLVDQFKHFSQVAKIRLSQNLIFWILSYLFTQ